MTPLGEFGAPPDAAAWSALAAALFVAIASADGRVAALFAPRKRVLIVVLALLSGVLSALYVAHYLRGGPRIIDATSYYLEARAFANGHVSFPVPAPSGSFRGRFLLASEDASALSVIFPPGYPALLALGFLAGVPLAVGPVLAVLIVLVTADVAERLFADDRTTLLAAAFSAVCAVLRYHTADTMSHGLAALLLAVVVSRVLRGSTLSFALAGFSAGWLFATRPASGLVAGAIIAFAGRRSPRGSFAALAAAALPVAGFFLHQRFATGNALESTQLAYYALADGPPGCFRYGFGAGIGCVFEHGDFVAARLRDGFGPLEATLTTLRRLKMHLADAGNVEVFAPLVVVAAVRALGQERARLAALGFFGVVAVYVPFYFDGNYPGGGARFFADALPLEHALLAASVVRLRLARFALPISLAGFALHTSYDHRALAHREGGRPMFEERVLAGSGVSSGLVFVETDHGFNLGHAPGVRDASRDIVVARHRGDAHDVLLWEALGRPPAFDYVFSTSGGSSGESGGEPPRIVTRTFSASGAVLRFEGEAEWPVIGLEHGSAFPDFPACASARRALLLRPSKGGTVNLRLEVVAPRAARYRVGTGWVALPGAGLDVRVTAGGLSWPSVVTPSENSPCQVAPGVLVDLRQGRNFVEVSTSYECWLDFVELREEAAETGPPPASRGP